MKYKDIGKRIMQLRKNLNMTQDKFAQSIGCSRNMVALVENGNREFSDRTLEDISEITGCNLNWLRHGEGGMFDSYMDPFVQAATEIAKGDERMREMILMYWKLPEQKKKLFWEFIDALSNTKK